MAVKNPALKTNGPTSLLTPVDFSEIPIVSVKGTTFSNIIVSLAKEDRKTNPVVQQAEKQLIAILRSGTSLSDKELVHWHTNEATLSKIYQETVLNGISHRFDEFLIPLGISKKVARHSISNALAYLYESLLKRHQLVILTQLSDKDSEKLQA